MAKNKQYEEISFVLEPDSLEYLANDINESLATQQNQPQKQSFIKSVDLVQQHKILYNKPAREQEMLDDERIDNLYTKVNVAQHAKFQYGLDQSLQTFEEDSDAEEVGPAYRLANGYKKLHDADIERFSNTLFIKINDKVEQIDVSKIASPKTMDKVIDHIQNTYGVSISKDQRKYMRVLFNQGGPQGMAGAVLSSCLVDKDGNVIASADHEQKNILSFKDGKLESTETVTKFNGMEEFQGKEGIATTKIDLSKLKGEKSTSSAEYFNSDFIPDKNCKAKVELFYQADGLPISLDEQIDAALMKHARLECTEFTKTRFSFFSRIGSFFKNPFSIFGAKKNSQYKEENQSGLRSFFNRFFSKNAYNKVKTEGVEVTTRGGKYYNSSDSLCPDATPKVTTKHARQR